VEFDEEIFRKHAEFCSLFSSVTRMKILWLLTQKGECKAGELAEEIGASAQNISQHLRVMRDRLAVTMRKSGREIYYRVSNESFVQGAALIRKGVIEELTKQSDGLK
jgi:DNA-binding transcriptional ArsR family regulator